MKKILVATDFSENSVLALNYGHYLAKKLDATLFIGHCFLPPFVDQNTPVDLIQQIQDDAEKSYQQNLDKLVEEAKQKGIEAHSVLYFSDVVSGIKECIKDKKIDLIIVGRTGNGGFLDKLLGSTATRLISNTGIPLLLVPPMAHEPKFDNIIYATQLEHEETDILKEVFAFSHKCDAHLKLVKVNADFEPDIEIDNDFIEEIDTEFENEDYSVEIIKAKTVKEGLTKTMEQNHADLLVVSTFHRNFITQLIDPSKSKQILQDSKFPVMVFHFDD